MKILALDIATKTGWATETASGVWDLAINKGESYGMKLIRFKAKLREIVALEGIDLIAYEKPSGRFVRAVSSISEMVGVLVAFCEENGINYTGYTVSEIKKFATGKGSANKDLMIRTARQKYGISPIDDNHADALHIYHLAKERLQ